MDADTARLAEHSKALQLLAIVAMNCAFGDASCIKVAFASATLIDGYQDHSCSSRMHSRSCTCLRDIGPAGSGKSATVQVLAHAAGFSITEWHAPLPTLWHEHCYQVRHSRQPASCCLLSMAAELS